MNSLKDKKVLVTGGAGFIGSHLTDRLVSEGAKVSVIVKYNSIIDSISQWPSNIDYFRIWRDCSGY